MGPSQKSIAVANLELKIKEGIEEFGGGDLNLLWETIKRRFPNDDPTSPSEKDKGLVLLLKQLTERENSQNKAKWVSVARQTLGFTRLEMKTKFEWHIGRKRTIVCIFFASFRSLTLRALLVWTSAGLWEEPGLPSSAMPKRNFALEIKEPIEKFMRSPLISRVAPNEEARVKSANGEWETVPRRWTALPWISCYRKFRIEYPQCHISYSTFYKNLPRDVSHAKRATDKCSHCWWGEKVIYLKI